jgi:NADPH-dependent curcumin reductase CurA
MSPPPSTEPPLPGTVSRGENRQIVLARRPTTLPTPGDFRATTGPLPPAAEGQVLIGTLLLSIDPAMRGRVLEAPNYLPAVKVGEVMRSFGLGEVTESRSAHYRPGDLVLGMLGWQEWAVLDDRTPANHWYTSPHRRERDDDAQRDGREPDDHAHRTRGAPRE